MEFFEGRRVVMPLALLLACLFLWFTSPQKEHYPGEPKRSATNLCQKIAERIRPNNSESITEYR